jgi:hypothetical protein
MDHNSKWMLISGFTGFVLFLIANFTNIFVGLSVFSGILQIVVNIFVFVVWLRAFRQSMGLKKFVAFFGVIVPVVMASITIVRVFLPVLKL